MFLRTCAPHSGHADTSDHVRSGVCMKKLDNLEDDIFDIDLKENLLLQAQEIYTASIHPETHNV